MVIKIEHGHVPTMVIVCSFDHLGTVPTNLLSAIHPAQLTLKVFAASSGNGYIFRVILLYATTIFWFHCRFN